MLLFNHSVVSDFCNPLDCSTPCFLVLHGLPEFAQIQWALNQWCHATISFSVASFSSCPQSFPASGSFPMSQHFASGSQSTGASASASVLPMNIQGWFPLGLIGMISLLSQGLSKILQHFHSKSSIIWHSFIFMVQLSHSHKNIRKNTALTAQTFVSKVMPLLFNTLSRFVIALLPRSNHFLISWLKSLSVVIWDQENKICCYFQFFPIYLSWSDGTGCHGLSFLNVEF